MWISRRAWPESKREALAEGGEVTVEEQVGVYAEGERRGLPVYGPGGYRWRPCAGEQVLVLKLGQDGEQPCVAGSAIDLDSISAGDVEIYTEGARIRLSKEGRVDIDGQLFINGEPYAPCRCG